ncbi:hypothetical protein HanXRQr2_Chr05g0215891 [Helianthus annuus]|uniref:Uncharacterized protein n=1 Tax=Helianthus annuus TaxID=4232 RepID=A0A9K3NNU8_HELAN|nr:hypothetical protein HanXRQr2_Chr05g0215891 [Helianthus annuus]KAJ0922836.1 hypothetical protein HanPSC8_Chr05g0208431 [Helianthus annuus]
MLTICKSNLVSQQFNINMNLEIVIVHTRLIVQAFFYHIAQSHQQLYSKPHSPPTCSGLRNTTSPNTITNPESSKTFADLNKFII